MSAAGAGVRRLLSVALATVLVGLVFVSAERARPAPTRLGLAIGIEPLEPRLTAISDAIALAHRAPSAADDAVARRAAQTAPLDALPYYIATSEPGRDIAQKRALIAHAVRRDPRLRPALAWRLVDFTATKDVAGVTRTLLRLAVLTPSNPKLWPAVAQISADPSARAIIKRQLAQGVEWSDAYLNALNQSPVDRAVIFDMVQSVGKGRHTARRVLRYFDDRSALINSLVTQKEYERAYLAWVQWLPAGSQGVVGYVFDGGFTGAHALAPFAWQLSDGAGGATALDPAGGLSLDYAGTDGAVVAQQMLLLSPGRYRLVTEADFAPVSGDATGTLLSWTLTCLPDGKPLNELGVPLVGKASRVGGAPFEVIQGCAAQTLLLKINSAEFATRLSGKIRSISVEAVK